MLKSRGIVFDHEYQSLEDIENCDYYHDFLARHGRKWFAGLGAAADGDNWCLALQRTPALGPFGLADRAKLTFVRDALANAMTLSNQMGHAWMSGLRHALSVVGQPAIVFDSQARVVEINDAAERIVGGFIDGDRHVRPKSPHATAVLDALLRVAFRSRGALNARDASCQIEFGSALYACRALSLLDNERLLATTASVLLVLQPVAGNAAATLTRVYGLTDAEVRVAVALARGRDVKDIAAEHCCKEETIRTHLKRVFAKTDVKKQSQLVAFVRDLVDRPPDR